MNLMKSLGLAALPLAALALAATAQASSKPSAGSSPPSVRHAPLTALRILETARGYRNDLAIRNPR